MSELLGILALWFRNVSNQIKVGDIMKVLDVDLLHDGLIRNINRMNRLEKEITAIQKAVEKLTAMEEALKGEGGQAIRDFYTSCHLPFLQYFLSFKEEFNTVLQQAQQALVSLEPVDAGHIVEEFLETKVEEGLTESATITAALTDEANAIMDEVSDIVGLPKLDDTLVQESVADAKTKRDDTVEALHTFDSTQTTQLVPIESSIQSMKEWVQNIEGLFQEGLTDVNFPTDKWSSITGNSAIAMSLSAMGVENGIDSQEMLACERPVETDVKEDKAWYKVVGDVLVGIAEGVAKAIADIFTGLFDLLKNLFTDPVGFFGGLATAIMNPIDTAKQMWGAVEAAWERDVVNGDARSRAEFFSYGIVSVIGVKGLDKLGKAGKLGNAASKADNTLPYNAMKTDKLKETLKTNVYATVQQKAQQAADFWKSNFSKEAINKTIEAVKNSAIITKAKNTLDPANIKAAAAKTYDDVVKTPIAKTQAALKAKKAKKEQLLDMPLPNFGLAPVPLGPTTNMTVREGIEATKDTVMQAVGKQDGGGKRDKDTVNLSGKVLKDRSQVVRLKLSESIAAFKNTDEYINLSNTQRKKIDRKINTLLNNGNVATADVNILGVKKEFNAHSQIHSSDSLGADVMDFSYATAESNRIFKNYVIDEFPRYNDTEVKILEDIASKIKDPNIKGEINLFSELNTCQSCTNVILEFREKYPNIKLNVFTNDTVIP
ncbi:T7SS effector LXG polymorphic toxin [Lysinibacillus odysseyi]|uniref:T7SS effector LXG polymorphic toxin n=2 Tax=Lysinibacillus odysseyi TaxID=202611 RepID=UPI0012E01FA2|nr:T7SS effector LXG polymorphic toxin [Lysinibacillus odysseyi]